MNIIVSVWWSSAGPPTPLPSAAAYREKLQQWCGGIIMVLLLHFDCVWRYIERESDKKEKQYKGDDLKDVWRKIAVSQSGVTMVRS